MREEYIDANNVGKAVQEIIRRLDDRRFKAIYFDGWYGLAASAVLRSIAQDPPPSLLKKFDKIIHVDCSRWKSRRALQRAIAEELKLPQRVMAIFDRQDEEDDFSGVDEGSRTEIEDIGREIYRALQEHSFLVVFHNGSDGTVDLTDFGIPSQGSRWSLVDSMVLWTFRGRLRLNPEISSELDLNDSHLRLDGYSGSMLDFWLQEEAREVSLYTSKLGVTPEIAAECCLYMLSLNSKGGNIMDYNWAAHASNYWVCDGIVQGGQDSEAWEAAGALHQQLRLEDYSNNTLPDFGDYLEAPAERWILVTDRTKINNVTVPPKSTSFFLAVQSGSDIPLASLPNDMFHQSDKLRVLKLCRCTFSFSSPPFRRCRSLRFLGLDGCKDQQQEQEQDKKQEKPAVENFQSLWVLDVCNTDWELALSPEMIEQMAANIREVHIKKGRIWSSRLAWRQLRNLRKLRVIEPTSPWETGEEDEFADMVKLELLDLSGNSTIQVLPSLSGATGLKTLILDGCVGLEHVGLEGLPPSLESFSLDAGAVEDHNKEAKISRISLAGCARLVNFVLRGSLPNLEELDLSRTLVKTLDLKSQVVQVPCLQRMILSGCLQLSAILWPEEGLPELMVIYIDPFFRRVQTEHHQAYATIMDLRFVQSLVLRSGDRFCWNTDRFHLILCGPSTGKHKGQTFKEEEMGLGSYCTYADIAIDKITTDYDDSSTLQFQPSGCHVEICEGIRYTNVEGAQLIKGIILVMNEAENLHVHDNCSITTIITTGEQHLYWRSLKRCRVERCPKLDTVFTTRYIECFTELETFWAADLLMAHCIWNRGRPGRGRPTDPGEDTRTFAKLRRIFGQLKFASTGRMEDGTDTWTFAKLRSIHLYSCPRLTFVLPLSWAAPGSYLPNLETLHIVYCGDLRQVFPVEARFLQEIDTGERKGTLEFPNLKHIHLHELPRLQQICEAKMFAPKLESIKLRGCWSLRRLPAVGLHRRPVVDCEKDWWEKLEWDGLDPSLYEPRHSLYYKKPLPRGSVLR